LALWQWPISHFHSQPHLRCHPIPHVLLLTQGNGYDYCNQLPHLCDGLRSQCQLKAHDVSFVINDGWGVGRLSKNHFSEWPTWPYILCTLVIIALLSQVEKSRTLIFLSVLSVQSYKLSTLQPRRTKYHYFLFLHKGIDGNETADQLARQGSSHPFTGPEPALGVSAKVTRGVIRDWTSRKHEEHWQCICGQKQAKGFLKKPSARKAGLCSAWAQTSSE
jgi:hypothetical protein